MNNPVRHSVFAAFGLVVLAGAGQSRTIFNDGANDLLGAHHRVESVTIDFTATGGASPLSVDGYGNGYDDLVSVMLNSETMFEGNFDMGSGGSNLVTTDSMGRAW